MGNFVSNKIQIQNRQASRWDDLTKWTVHICRARDDCESATGGWGQSFQSSVSQGRDERFARQKHI